MSHLHVREVCSCGTPMGECRCPALDKATRIVDRGCVKCRRHLGETITPLTGEESIQDLEVFAQVMKKTKKQLERYVITTAEGDPYLERMILIKDELYLHVIYRSDDDREPHNHPFVFSSRILHGSYKEERYNRHGNNVLLPDTELSGQVYGPGDVNKVGLDVFHRLEVLEGPVVTLVERGPKLQEWGFWSEGRFVHNREYLQRKFGSAVAEQTYE